MSAPISRVLKNVFNTLSLLPLCPRMGPMQICIVVRLKGKLLTRSNAEVMLFFLVSRKDKDLSFVCDVLQAAAGSHIAVKDTFRLGKQLKQPQQTRKQQSSNVSEKNGSLPTTHSSCTSEPTRPRPILIKLNCPWDRRIIFAGKKRLSSINGMEKYFLQPDLPVEERKKRRAAYLA